jgi:uncharacterized protein (TIGR02679 family)
LSIRSDTAQQQVKHYFSKPGFRKLLDTVWNKYASLERIGGNAVLERVTEEECEAINLFFGWNCKPGDKVEVPLPLFEGELRGSRFAIGIAELHVLLKNEPLLTKREKEQVNDKQWRKLFQTVIETTGEGLSPVVMEWIIRVKQGHGAGVRTLREQYKSAPDEASLSLGIAVRALQAVFGETNEGLRTPIRLPVLAARMSGDAHALDLDRPAGRMFMACLRERMSGAVEEDDIEKADKADDGAATLQRREIYRSFGVLDDDLSSIVHWFVPEPNLPVLPVVWTLRQVEAAVDVPRCSHIYVVENPAVFSTVLDGLTNASPFYEECPALLCTSGPASAAAIRWIRRCLAVSSEDCRIYYSGDFDLKGLSMGQTLAELFPDRFVPWRFSSTTYQSSLPYLQGLLIEEEELERLGKMNVSWDSSLCAFMSISAKKIHQESFVKQLREDYIAAVCRAEYLTPSIYKEIRPGADFQDL